MPLKPPNSRAPNVTSRDVARFLGVSQSMVSRAFDTNGRVSAKNRDKILKAAELLDYRPNYIARSLSTRRSGIIAIVMGSGGGLENPFYADVLDQLGAALDAVGYRSLFFRAPPDQDVDEQLPALRQYNIDGVIVASASISSRIAREFQRDQRRIVLFNRTISNALVPSVSCDNTAGAREIADLLIDRGHRRMVYVAGPEHTSTNRDREAGFLARLNERGLAPTALIRTTRYSFGAGVDAARQAAGYNPDAIFFANDILALGGMDYLRWERRRIVPGQISVVGFDDIPMASWPAYRLTTVRQKVDEMVSLTVAIITSSTEPRTYVIPGQLILRDSVRP
jgi:DNA-binding LacI/PurR family transcriptional regulator